MRIKQRGIAVGLGLVLLGAAGTVSAAGFKVNEQDAKAMGMANAFTAQADNPSALYYNPAGITQLSPTQVSLGSLVINVPQTEFVGSTELGSGTEKAKRDIFIVPTFYVTHAIEGTPVTLGFGINSIYPLAKTWDDGSIFRHFIQDIAIKPINFQPTIAYKVNDSLSVAAGVDMTYAQVSLRKVAYNPLTSTDIGVLSTDGTATDFGYNMGLMWKPCTNIKVGVNYRSAIKLHIDGDANLLAPSASQGSPSVSLNSPAATSIKLPSSLALGVSWKPNEKVTLEIDAERTNWSSYQNLNLIFTSQAFSGLSNKPNIKNWKDVWAYRVGGQYALTPNLDLRAGYAYDNTPAPDATVAPELPDADRHNFSVGVGIHKNNVALDLAYMYVLFKDRNVYNYPYPVPTMQFQNGTYSSDVHIMGANLTVKF